MVNVNALSGPSDYRDPVDSTSISQAYLEQPIPDIQAFRRQGASRSSSSSRSVERPRRTPSMALSAQLVTLQSASPLVSEENKVRGCLV